MASHKPTASSRKLAQELESTLHKISKRFIQLNKHHQHQRKVNVAVNESLLKLEHQLSNLPKQDVKKSEELIKEMMVSEICNALKVYVSTKIEQIHAAEYKEAESMLNNLKLFQKQIQLVYSEDKCINNNPDYEYNRDKLLSKFRSNPNDKTSSVDPDLVHMFSILSILREYPVNSSFCGEIQKFIVGKLKQLIDEVSISKKNDESINFNVEDAGDNEEEQDDARRLKLNQKIEKTLQKMVKDEMIKTNYNWEINGGQIFINATILQGFPGFPLNRVNKGKTEIWQSYDGLVFQDTEINFKNLPSSWASIFNTALKYSEDW